MGNSAIKTFKVKNQYKDPVYFKIGLKELKTNVFENQGEDFYRRSRGFQRIGPGDIVAEELDVSRKEVVYFTVGTDSGMQITDCLSKQAFGRTLVISEAGSLTDRRLTTFWNYEESEVRKSRLLAAAEILYIKHLILMNFATAKAIT